MLILCECRTGIQPEYLLEWWIYMTSSLVLQLSKTLKTMVFSFVILVKSQHLLSMQSMGKQHKFSCESKALILFDLKDDISQSPQSHYTLFIGTKLSLLCVIFSGFYQEHFQEDLLKLHRRVISPHWFTSLRNIFPVNIVRDLISSHVLI